MPTMFNRLHSNNNNNGCSNDDGGSLNNESYKIVSTSCHRIDASTDGSELA